MRVSDDLKKWVQSLSMGEKRFIRLLGTARARAQDSQRLDLLTWIETARDGDSIPMDEGLQRNLPVVSDRLKDLILDGLHLLHKDADVDAQLGTAVGEIALLSKKKLYDSAIRTIRRAKKLAKASSRYLVVLQLLDWERRISTETQDAALPKLLAQWRVEEKVAMDQLRDLQELHWIHTTLRMHEREVMAPRNISLVREAAPLAESELVLRSHQEGNYVEKALATNILGIYDLLRGDLNAAVFRYKGFLEEWQGEIKWQVDQGPLLLSISSFFQIACFSWQSPWEETQRLLKLLPQFDFLGPQAAFNHQRKLHVRNFALALNTGNMDSLPSLIIEIEGWIRANAEEITPIMLLPLLHNFAVAEFILGNHSSANKYVQRILNLPNRKARVDIRNFALLLQAILQYELGDNELNEYLTRAAKRHFRKSTREVDFEMAVFRFLEKALRLEHTDSMPLAVNALVVEIEELVEQVRPGGMAVLGLMEVRLWAQAKQRNVPLREVFLEAVRATMESLR